MKLIRKNPLVVCLAFRVLGYITMLAIAPALPAQNGTPAPRPEDQPSLMRMLADEGRHDIDDETWNLYGQFTYISDWKPAFNAGYTNLNGSINSLLPSAERSFTGTGTLYLGARLWHGAELYFAPELISEQPFSQLRGLGGAIQNFELQKGGTPSPTLYVSRVFVKQTFGFGGGQEAENSGPLQLGAHYDRRRLVLSVGNFSILDFFDSNAFDIDPRQGFLGLGFMTHAAWDFASDARGYSYGGVAELYLKDWAVRFGRITPPKDPNQLPVDFRLWKYYGDQVEIEHRHSLGHRDGVLRVLGYRNRESIGRFADAIAAFDADPAHNAAACQSFNYGSENASAPDLCWVRRPNVKKGVGGFAEQRLTNDLGVFVRGMYSDGKTEVDAYTSADRSLAFGVLGHGGPWRRSKDVAGVGFDFDWISAIHAEYLAMGGVDGFIGDGAIRPGGERALDAFYSYHFGKWFWLTGDYQHVINPGFNRDRGPVNIFSFRIHGEI